MYLNYIERTIISRYASSIEIIMFLETLNVVYTRSINCNVTTCRMGVLSCLNSLIYIGPNRGLRRNTSTLEYIPEPIAIWCLQEKVRTTEKSMHSLSKQYGLTEEASLKTHGMYLLHLFLRFQSRKDAPLGGVDLIVRLRAAVCEAPIHEIHHHNRPSLMVDGRLWKQ